MHDSILTSAHSFAACGFSVIPVDGKKPALASWAHFQKRPAHADTITCWHKIGILRGFGVVLGRVSRAVVIDLDGDEAVDTFRRAMPHLLDTYTVTSGSGHGQHLYYRPTIIPPTARIPGYELRSGGCYVVAPPSPHPSGNTYAVFHRVPMMRVDNMCDVLAWLREHAPKPAPLPPNPLRPVSVQQNNAQHTDEYIRRGRAMYFNSALQGELERVRTAPQGGRNNTLFTSVLRIASYIDAAGADEARIGNEFAAAAKACGLPDGEAWRTIASAMRVGLGRPRHIPTRTG